MKIDLQNHKFPIGPYISPKKILAEDTDHQIAEIEGLPLKLRATVSNMSEDQLETPYREGGWTVRQVVHHLPDSHMSSYMRFKLALTEDNPTIRPFMEHLWAELPEARSGSLEMSLDLLAALHIRWAESLRNLTPDDLGKSFVHPEFGIVVTLKENICHYAWHGNHHLAQIESLKVRKGWN